MVYFTILQTHSMIGHERWSLTELCVICVVAGEWEKLDLPVYVLIGVRWHKLQKVKTGVLKLVLTGQNPVH